MRILLSAALTLSGCASTSDKIDFHVREMKPTQDAFQAAYPGAQHYAAQRDAPISAELVLKSDHPLTRETARIEHPEHDGIQVCGIHSYYDASLHVRQRREACFDVADIHRIRMQDYKKAADRVGGIAAGVVAAPLVAIGATVMAAGGAREAGPDEDPDEETVDNTVD